MSRWTGRLERRDLEGGLWILHTRDGAYTLYGEVPRELADGHVEVEGDSEEGFGIGMTGPAITVRKVRRA